MANKAAATSTKKQEAAQAAPAAVGESPVTAPVVVTEPEPDYYFGEILPEGHATIGTGVIAQVDPSYLSIKRGFNVRNFKAKENVEHVQALRELIEPNGVETPLWVRYDTTAEGARLVVVRGESRLRAVLAIRQDKGPSAMPTVPVILAPNKSSAEQVIDFVVESSGKNLSMLETLDAVNRLRADGVSRKTVQERLAKSHTFMRNLEILAWATPEVHAAIADGWLSATNVIDKLRESDGDETLANLASKKLMAAAERAKNAGEKAAKGKKAPGDDESGEEDGRKSKGDGIVYNKATQRALIRAIQDTLALLTPAKQFPKQRETLKAALTNAGAPFVPAETKAAIEAAAAAEEEEVAGD